MKHFHRNPTSKVSVRFASGSHVILRTQFLLAACVAALLPSSAFGNMVIVNTELDLADLEPGLNGFTAGVEGKPPFVPGFSVQVAEGDEFHLTIQFKGDQTLSIDRLKSIWAFAHSGYANSDAKGTGVFHFLDTSGSVLHSSNQKTDTEGVFHFGQFFYNPDDFAGLPDPIVFGGIRYVGTLVDYLDPAVTVRTYDTPAFYFNGGSYQASIASVPDLSASALLLALGVVPLVALRIRSTPEVPAKSPRQA